MPLLVGSGSTLHATNSALCCIVSVFFLKPYTTLNQAAVEPTELFQSSSMCFTTGVFNTSSYKKYGTYWAQPQILNTIYSSYSRTEVGRIPIRSANHYTIELALKDAIMSYS